jgi:Uma2 family endonuclease
MWRQNGVRLVWVVHPDTRAVDVYTEGRPVTTLTEEDALDGLDVLPGFVCSIGEIFEDS